MKRINFAMLLLGATLLLGGCSSYPAMKTVDAVDLDRFMGDWYVIASIPTVFEKDIYNAIERYDRIGANKIQTTFSFYKGGFDGEKDTMRPVGYVMDDGSNALWGMQFIWPFKADYRIVYLDDDYSLTVIGRQKRDYVWVMARKPQLDSETYAQIVRFIESLGYDTTELKPVPQQWTASTKGDKS